jgi:hypothetical protein
MKNAIDRSSDRPWPTSSRCPPSAPCCPRWLKMSRFLKDNLFSRTLSFAHGSGHFSAVHGAFSNKKRLTLDNMGPPFWARNGWETDQPKCLYGPYDGLLVRLAAAQTYEPSSGPYISLSRAVSQIFLAQNYQYIVPSYLWSYFQVLGNCWSWPPVKVSRFRPFLSYIENL